MLIAVQIPAWLLIGGATWLATRALTPHAPPAPLLLATVLSWLLGFLAIPVPGGIGVREAMFTALAATVMPVGTAAAAALLARVLFMAIDSIGVGAIMVLRPPTSATVAGVHAPAGEP